MPGLGRDDVRRQLGAYKPWLRQWMVNPHLNWGCRIRHRAITGGDQAPQIKNLQRHDLLNTKYAHVNHLCLHFSRPQKNPVAKTLGKNPNFVNAHEWVYLFMKSHAGDETVRSFVPFFDTAGRKRVRGAKGIIEEVDETLLGSEDHHALQPVPSTPSPPCSCKQRMRLSKKAISTPWNAQSSTPAVKPG